MNVCGICKKEISAEDQVVTLGKKGSDGVNRASSERGDTISVEPGEIIHTTCRKNFCRASSVRKAQESVEVETAPRPRLRASLERQFNFKSDCLLCGNEIDEEEEKKRCRDVYRVRSLEYKDSVLTTCDVRGDKWAETVRARVLCVHDLPAADAMYHKACHTNFGTGREIPKQYCTLDEPEKKRKIGRPQDDVTNDAFLKTMRFLHENDDQQLTVSDLVEKMNEYLVGNSDRQPYSNRYMKQKIKEHFGDNVFITNLNGKPNLVTIGRTAAAILHDFHLQQKGNPDTEQEKLNLIETAAKLIRNDIKLATTFTDNYPSIETDVQKHLDILPSTLNLLLKHILTGKNNSLKIASIGQAIMQCARSRALISPLQVGVGVQMHHSYASRFLVDLLHQLGFCCSYNEVIRYKQNAAVNQGTYIPDYDDEFMQYSADNTDHNVRTLDGHNTFHGMGIIAAVTPGTSGRIGSVPRHKVTGKDIVDAGSIEIKPPSQPRVANAIKFEEVKVENVEDRTSNLDVLWKTSFLFGDKRPGWAGFMQVVHKDEKHNGQSSISFLPMIDVPPSDETSVNSTLEFVLQHAEEHGIANPIITFDQPLWWKAYCLVNTELATGALQRIIVRLGGFHTQMSYLGSIGHLMAESGLKELLELIYAPNAVEHMLSGKAVARAVRGHLIMDAALNALLYSNALGISIPQLETAGIYTYFLKLLPDMEN